MNGVDMSTGLWYDKDYCKVRQYDPDSMEVLNRAADMVSEGGVITVCYNQAEVWADRKAAVTFFLECMYNSEGAESERYENVFFDLLAGLDIAHDGVSWKVREVVVRQ